MPRWHLVCTSHKQAMWLWASQLPLLGLSFFPSKMKELDQIITKAHVLLSLFDFMFNHHPDFSRVKGMSDPDEGPCRRADSFLPRWQSIRKREVITQHIIAKWLTLPLCRSAAFFVVRLVDILSWMTWVEHSNISKEITVPSHLYSFFSFIRYIYK